MNKRKLIREQLEASLERFGPLRTISPPPKGWIRAIRDALGMTARQLGARLGVAQQAVTRIERDERTGSVTIKTMRRVAAGLDCVFVYGFVPRESLEKTVRARARTVALERLSRASQTMALEDQSLAAEETRAILEDMVEEIVDKISSSLWENA